MPHHTWTMYAQRRSPSSKEARYYQFGTKQWAALGRGEKTVEVCLWEDPEGSYWGWADAGEDAPVYIEASYEQLDEVFRAGDPDEDEPKVAEDNGRGRVVRLSVGEASTLRMSA